MAKTAYIRRHESWQKHAKERLAKGRQPAKFKDWQVEPTYIQAMTQQTPKSQLKAAGIDWEKDKPSKRLSRKKK